MNTVVSLATPGLGNRIKTYVSAMAKYEVVKTSRDSDSVLFGAIEKASSQDIAIFPKVDGWRLDVMPDEEKYIKDYKTIDFLYEKTPDYFVEKYLKIFSSLNINRQILDKVENFSKSWTDIIGLHIRSWYCQRNNWHDISLFENEIDKFNDNKKIFLCTDNLTVSDYFTKKYGDRVIKYPQALYNDIAKAESGYNHDVSDNVNALIDMLLLSKCPTIIGTFASSFTECAWWFSECKSNVIIPVPSNVPQDFLNDVFILK